MKKFNLNILIGSLALIIFGYVLVSGIQNRNSSDNSITVTGMSQTDFTSDLIVWSGTFTTKNSNLEAGYKTLAQNAATVRQYLISKGLKAEELVFSAVSFYKDYNITYTSNGNSISTFSGYVLNQSVQIDSREVDKISEISRDATSLINQGIEFSSQQPQYYYTKLAELKLQMIASASADARKRAEQIVDNASGKLQELQSASMGVFQITAQNSNEEYSSGGSFNTGSKDKSASITVRLKYRVK